MKKTKLKLILLVMVIAIISMACGFSASTANIKDAYMALDEAGKEKTTIYPQDAVFYCIVTLANAPSDTSLKAVWTAVEAKDTEANFKIDEVTTTMGDGTVPFTLTNNNMWPTGKYKVDLYINDQLKQTINFEVQ